ncbi:MULTISPECIES: FMN-binding protein MioC [Corallincola]|uniref:FMN-binding protein MioC n=3 Tax=Corallincola TaxID=1775176 RepID=A0A368N7A8_9GAMM|nr:MULTISPECIES: FMN-binding protein MioC [Corallincola]RCU45414.1 FMN-binding protein MioC [Corallincola holothuriorum]TAA41076.1 FMN-binding protein MioC [Corallincola spongiicola]TCI02728.1 FMN-binding protein MioC [Corallincola luteus]
MSNTVQLLVGSMLGATEYVADHAADLLQQAGYSTEIVIDFNQWRPRDDESQRWLICTSTHGAGDLPDNIQPLAEYLLMHRPNLASVKYGVIGLGDSSYDTFCEGSKTLDTVLEDLGAYKVAERLEIDVQETPIPEDAAEAWLPQFIEKIA